MVILIYPDILKNDDRYTKCTRIKEKCKHSHDKTCLTHYGRNKTRNVKKSRSSVVTLQLREPV